MRTKKILALLLCIVITCLALVSCDDEIGTWLDKYDWEPEVVAKVEFDLYIIVGEGTDDVAMITVSDKINQYLDDKYNTTLNINYISADEYAASISSIINPVSRSTVIYDDETQYGGKIVLIDSKETYDSLAEANLLSDLSAYLDTKEFASLNTQLTETIVDAARESSGALYAIPNEHVIGEYEYVIINRAIAEGQLHYSAQSELLEITSIEDAAELISVAGALGYAENEVVRVVTGSYENKAYWESEGWICNVSEYPQATKEAVFASAFGVVADGDSGSDVDFTYRAMQIIYSINADETLRNLLQYGVENTNYQMKNGIVVPLTGEGSEYNMNIIYTGDVFKAYYCDGVWTAEMKSNGEVQNKEAVLYEQAE